MKKICFSLLAIVLVLNIVSCSNDQSGVETPKGALLKKASIKRNASGKYTVAYETESHTISDRVKVNSSSNEFHLSKVAYNTKNLHTEDVLLAENNLHISFIDHQNNMKTKWSVEDENMNFPKGAALENLLKSYALTISSNDEVQLSFEVEDNVSTEFSFNEETDTYEVHLRELTSSAEETSFDRVLSLSDSGGGLRLDFVNHSIELAAKEFGSNDVNPYYRKPSRRPRIIWQFPE